MTERPERSGLSAPHFIDEIVDYAIFRLDAHGNVVTWNEGARRIKGYEAAEIIGKPYATFYREADIQDCERALHTAAEQGRYVAEGVRVRKDGSEFWASVVLTALHEQGKLVGFAKVTRDLTEQRRAQEIERKLWVEQEIGREKDEFLGALSHELRSPMNAVFLWTSVLRSRTTDPRLLEAVDAIERNSRKEVRLLDELLDVSMLATKRLALSRSRVDLGQLLGEALLEVQAHREGKELRWQLDVEPGIVLALDPARMRQALWHVLDNAAKFSHRQGEVIVALHPHADAVVLRVRDGGVGVAPEALSRVFSHLKQAEGSDTRHFGGLGIGLTIVRGVVELHGGRVILQSDGKDLGTEVTVRLPLG